MRFFAASAAEDVAHLADDLARARRRSGRNSILPASTLARSSTSLMSCSRCCALVRMSPRYSLCCGDTGADLAVVHQLGEADDRVERRAQLVRHVGEELALQPAGLLDLAVLFFQFLVG